MAKGTLKVKYGRGNAPFSFDGEAAPKKEKKSVTVGDATMEDDDDIPALVGAADEMD